MFPFRKVIEGDFSIANVPVVIGLYQLVSRSALFKHSEDIFQSYLPRHLCGEHS